MLKKATSHEIIRSALFDINNQYDNRIDDIDTSLLVESALLIAFESHKSEHKEVLQNIAHSVCNYALTIERAKMGVSGFLCLGRLFQGQPNEAALCI